MKDHVQGCVTAGVAMVGAGVMAVTPFAAQQAPEALQASDTQAVNLMASSVPTPTQLLQAAVTLGGGVAESTARLGESLALGTLTPLELAQAIADQDAEAAYDLIEANIDAPLYVADPTIFAVNNVLPEPYGGGDSSVDPRYRSDSDVLAFRVDVLYAARQELRAVARESLGLSAASGVAAFAVAAVPEPPTLAEVPGILAAGVGASAVRLAESSAAGLLGPVAVAQQVAGGKTINQALYDVAESYMDAPLYIADPTIFAIDDVLPKPIGQDPSKDPRNMNSSTVTQFRANVLIPARDAIKPGLKNVLGVPVTEVELTGKSTQLTSGTSSTSANPLKGALGDSPVGSALKKAGAHRAATTNPVGSALKKISAQVKKATEPNAQQKD